MKEVGLNRRNNSPLVITISNGTRIPSSELSDIVKLLSTIVYANESLKSVSVACFEKI